MSYLDSKIAQGSTNLDSRTHLDSAEHLNTTSELCTNSLNVLPLPVDRKLGNLFGFISTEHKEETVVNSDGEKWRTRLPKNQPDDNLVKKFESRRAKVADLIFDNLPDFSNDNVSENTENIPNAVKTQNEIVIAVSDNEFPKLDESQKMSSEAVQETNNKIFCSEPVKDTKTYHTKDIPSLRSPVHEETLNISEKNIFLGGVDNIGEELKPTYSKWAQMFRKRKEKRELKNNSKSSEPDATMIPDTPEKGTVFEDTINWDDECFPPSDGENETRANFSSRKPLFPTSNNWTNEKVKTFRSPENEENKTNTSSDNSSFEHLVSKY